MPAVEERDYYADPERYEAEYAFYTADIDWYLSRALELKGPVLVLGSGSGRVLFRLAAAGLQVDGIDTSLPMLDFARNRALGLGNPIAERVDFFETDMRCFCLHRRYRTIMAPLNCLMHLHSDHEVLSCLQAVRQHLVKKGWLFMDITHPRPEFLAAHGGPEGLPLRDIRVRGTTYLQRERHRFDQRTRISEIAFIYEPRTPSVNPFVAKLRLRMFEPQEIDALLRQAGFEVQEKLGWFSGQAFDETSPMQIVAATRL